MIEYFRLNIEYLRYPIDLKKTERSDTIILGILAHFRHFRHFSGLSGLSFLWLKIESAQWGSPTEQIILKPQINQETVCSVKNKAEYGRCRNGKKMGLPF